MRCARSLHLLNTNLRTRMLQTMKTVPVKKLTIGEQLKDESRMMIPKLRLPEVVVQKATHHPEAGAGRVILFGRGPKVLGRRAHSSAFNGRYQELNESLKDGAGVEAKSLKRVKSHSYNLRSLARQNSLDEEELPSLRF